MYECMYIPNNKLQLLLLKKSEEITENSSDDNYDAAVAVSTLN